MSMTSAGTHRALRGLLLIIAVLLTIGGLIIVFWTAAITALMPVQPQFALSLLANVILKALGVFATGLGYLAFRASQDPVRYVAVIDMLIFLLLAVSAVEIWAVLTQHYGTIYPHNLIWLREAVRIIVAVVLLVLRPRQAAVARE